MTAPARTRRRSSPAQRSGTGRRTSDAAAQPARVTGTSRRGEAAARAYARRAHRTEVVRRRGSGRPRSAPGLLRLPRTRTSFVLLLMALMVTGVAATLWLSTQAIADSYRLERLRQENAHLAEQVERLQRDVSRLQSPPSLAERARMLGMVPGGNPARLVVGDDGTVTVVGEPGKAQPSPQGEQGTTGGD